LTPIIARIACAVDAQTAGSRSGLPRGDVNAQHFRAVMRARCNYFLHLMQVASIIRNQESNHVDRQQRICNSSTHDTSFQPHPAHTASGCAVIFAFFALASRMPSLQRPSLPSHCHDGNSMHTGPSLSCRHRTRRCTRQRIARFHAISIACKAHALVRRHQIFHDY